MNIWRAMSHPALFRCCTAVVLFVLTSALTQAQPTDAQIKEILTQRTDVDKQAVGLAVVIANGDQVRIVMQGFQALDKAVPISADTLFEIGSITKTFTALLLADMVIKGELKLDDPVEKWLPQGLAVGLNGLKLRDHTGAPIRLIDLATHRSGLPRLPDNMPNATRFDPYVDYREQQLLVYLKSREALVETDAGKTTKKRDEVYAYSNLGFGLLGYVLARAANMPYDELLQKRMLTPLGLTSTYLNIPRGDRSRYSDGHYVENGTTLKQAKHWRFDVIAPAGALLMSAKDMGRYAQAASGAVDTPLKAAFTLAQKRYGEGMGAKNPQGLGWILATLNDRAIVNHDGGTGGFSSTLWVDPERKSAVAVLSNAARPVTDIGLHLLEPSIPLANLAPMRATAIAVDAKSLEQFVGTYVLSPEFKVTIRTRDGKLFAQATGQGEFELFAKSAAVFFARITPLEIAFEDIKDGKAARFQLTQAGSTRPAQRVD